MSNHCEHLDNTEELQQGDTVFTRHGKVSTRCKPRTATVTPAPRTTTLTPKLWVRLGAALWRLLKEVSPDSRIHCLRRRQAPRDDALRKKHKRQGLDRAELADQMCRWVQGRERANSSEALITALAEQPGTGVIEATSICVQLYPLGDMPCSGATRNSCMEFVQSVTALRASISGTTAQQAMQSMTSRTSPSTSTVGLTVRTR